MYIHWCTLTLHENLFYATREIGRLYETGRYLHNYALTYALGLATAPYFHAKQQPQYATQLQPLNERGIYVTPAQGIHVTYDLHTFKYADNHYHVKMQPGQRNTPSFGRAKEIAVGSQFQFAVLSTHRPLALPAWIRMGLWRSKIKVDSKVVEAKRQSKQLLEASFPLNPLDIQGNLSTFDLISMPPSSLVDNVTMEAEWWVGALENAGKLYLPANMTYTFPKGIL